jgi:hypothetical protein
MTGPDLRQSPSAPARNNFYALIPHPQEPRFLLLPGERGSALPVYHPTERPAERHTAQVEQLNFSLREQFGVDVTTLLCAYLDLNRDASTQKVRDVNALFIMENHSPGWSPSHGAAWVGHEELVASSLEHEWQRPFIERWFAEEASGHLPALRPAWSRKGWRDHATEWTRIELAAIGFRLEGPLTQVKHWDISSVWRAQTTAGAIYFKATPALYAHEPRMTAGLARMFPAYIPAPLALATYPDQGWMLLRSFEGEVMWEPTLKQKEDVLRITARMQIEAASHIDELFAAGCVDFHLDMLPARAADLSRDDVALARLTSAERETLFSSLPDIEAACARLASGPIPQSLMHGDLHGGNITFHNGCYTIFDWTDGCVTHPYFDMLTFLDPADPDFDRLRDLYLAEWSSFAPLDALREAFDVAIRLGGLHHALSYRTINANVEPPMIADLEGALEYFLRRYLSA